MVGKPSELYHEVLGTFSSTVRPVEIESSIAQMISVT
jgi:hypothetical protein